MRALAIVGRDHPAAARCDSFELEGVTVLCAVLDVPEPRFDPAAQPGHVLVRTLGFSVNFRDRALVLRMATSDKTTGFYVVGSDFVGEVVAVGNDVSDLVPGDRVIQDSPWPPAWPSLGPSPWPPGGTRGHAGVPSNHGSREYQVLVRAALMPVPREMDVAVGASFGIGGQTAVSIVRRLAVSRGDRVLVTAPRSNTSLFVLAALSGMGVEIHGVTGSGRDAERLAALGVSHLVTADARGEPFHTHPGFGEVLGRGGYHAVADPFHDLYLPQVAPLMAFGARYVTCGMENQSSRYTGVERPRPETGDLMANVMIKNLAILGNCLGSTEDLRHAVARHAAGDFPVVMDSVFPDDPAGFLRRTYAERGRFGKVAFLYA